MLMNQVFLHTGTNLGDRLTNLERVNALIEEHIGLIIKVSPIYETHAWGITEQPDFLNQALEVTTHLTPIAILKKIYFIEQEKFNRVRVQKWAARIIDIDILFYNDTIINTPTLTIPHPFLHKRNFVLTPMKDIAPHLVHPILNQTIEMLYWNVADKKAVSRWTQMPKTVGQNFQNH